MKQILFQMPKRVEYLMGIEKSTLNYFNDTYESQQLVLPIILIKSPLC